MYSPKFNRVDDRAILLEAMRAYSFATLFGPVSAGPAPVGLTPADPTSQEPPSASATHLPLVVKDEGEHGLIEGHFGNIMGIRVKPADGKRRQPPSPR